MIIHAGVLLHDKVTLAMLRSAGACPSQVALFQRHFGKQAACNVRNLRRAFALGLHVAWIADRILTPAALAAYAQYGSDLLKAKQDFTMLPILERLLTEGLPQA